MENCCSGSQGSLSSPDASKHNVRTSSDNSSKKDSKVLSDTSDVLNDIVNSVENQCSDCDSIILSKTSVTDHSTIDQSVANSDKHTVNQSSTKGVSLLHDKEFTEKQLSGVKNDTVRLVAEGHGKPVKNVKVEADIESSSETVLKNIKVEADIKSCSETVFKSTNSEPRTKKKDEHGQQGKTVKKVKNIKQKPRRNPDGIIDQLFHAAQIGDKEDFKKLLYVNYDNIVNGFIVSKQSDSCISSEETERESEGCSFKVDQKVETSKQTDVENSDTSIAACHYEVNELDSKLVICEPEATQIIPKSEPSDTDTQSDNSPLIIKKSRRQSKDSVNELKRKSVPDFKTISRGIAVKKSKSYLTVSGSEVSVDQPSSSDNFENKNDFSVRLANIKQEFSTDDNISSSDIDETFTPKFFYIKQQSDSCGTDSSSSESKHEFTCQHCDKAYKNLVYLRNHQSARHLHEDTFMCEACSKVFFSLEKLKEHEKVHVKEEINYCELCKKGYSSRAAIRRHSETVHVVEKQRPHKCEICNFAFTCMWHLREHYRIHTDQRDYVCPVCKKAFNHIGSMNRHAKDQHNFDTSTGNYFDRKPKKPILLSPVAFQLIKPKITTAIELSQPTADTGREFQNKITERKVEDMIEIKVEPDDAEEDL